jgi:imidazolonepropionase-like amidohydrolase
MLAIEVDRLFDGNLVMSGGVVTVQDGRIVGVDPRGTSLPADCEVVRFPDATLLPGLIDTHTHLCGDSGVDALDRLPDFTDAEMIAVIEHSLQDELLAGVTTVQDLGDYQWAVVDWRDAHRDDIAFPTVLASGPPITIPGGHCWNMGGEVQGVEDFRRAVRQRAERQVDVVKIMASGGAMTLGTDVTVPQFTADEISVVVEEGHAHGLRVTAHAHAVDAIRAALKGGVDSVEHCTFLTQAGIVVDDDIVADLVRTGTPVCPTLGVMPGNSPPPRVLEMMRRLHFDEGSRNRLFADLHRAGVRLVSGSDSGIGPGKRHGVMRESVISLVEFGVPTVDALASATSGAADVCGLVDRKGRLRAGFDADLLVVDGDVCSDITALRNVQAVYVRGERRV